MLEPVSTRQRTRKAVARGKRSFESMMGLIL